MGVLSPFWVIAYRRKWSFVGKEVTFVERISSAPMAEASLYQ